MALTYVKETKHGMLCVTGCSKNKRYNMIFALECVSSEHLLYLFKKERKKKMLQMSFQVSKL